MAESDWDTVTVLRKKGSASQAKSKQAVLAAQRRGEDVETTKKWAAGQNKQHVITKNTAKLDRETEELHHERVTLSVGKAIQQGRQNKGLTQKDLATKINEKPQVIADYEAGKAIPNNQVMGKIERAIVFPLYSGDWQDLNCVEGKLGSPSTLLCPRRNEQKILEIHHLACRISLSILALQSVSTCCCLIKSL
ncbi:endothelial differentiation-related factor 1 homolog isoform X1 [Ictalurus furcatus]|uniref:endothelial differentiation-related factor 1 homolog isoform X1 n=1 Tax=Ictalurus furcatus TaxID=66913 RepID=UPI002350D491|nr:endothelial differentiation-related factor 1 homolog isoform X1 [Ictalurus furcatus]